MAKLGAFDAYVQDEQEKAELERQNAMAAGSDFDEPEQPQTNVATYRDFALATPRQTKVTEEL